MRIGGILVLGGLVDACASSSFSEWSGFPFWLCFAAFGWFLLWTPARAAWG